MVMHAVVHAQHAQLAGAQIQQLHALNAQFQQQMAEQQRQALLAQILFETEQVARRVRAVGKTDLFSAALHAEAWLPGISGIRSDFFLAVEAKRAMASAVEAMTVASQKARQDPAILEQIQNYERATNERARLEQLPKLQEIPLSEYRRLESAHVAAVAANAPNPKKFWITMSTSLIPIVLCVLAAVIGLVVAIVEAGAKSGTQFGAHMTVWSIAGTFPALIAGIVIGSFVVIRRQSRKGAAQSAAKALANASKWQEEVRAVSAAHLAFAENPLGGQFLDRIFREHPLLTQAPSPEAYEDSPRSVVERQTVVSRCQYCGNLTPVDLKGCQHCGAQLK